MYYRSDASSEESSITTPLYCAAEKGDLKEVERLISESDYTINQPRTISRNVGGGVTGIGERERPVEIAAINGHVSVVKKLLAAGAIITHDLICHAMKSPDDKLLLVVLDSIAGPPESAASLSDDIDIDALRHKLKVILNSPLKDESIKDLVKGLLHRVARHNEVEKVSLLLRLGYDPDGLINIYSYGLYGLLSPLTLATESKSLPKITRLLKEGVECNGAGASVSPLSYLLDNEKNSAYPSASTDYPLVKELVSHGAILPFMGTLSASRLKGTILADSKEVSSPFIAAVRNGAWARRIAAVDAWVKGQ